MICYTITCLNLKHIIKYIKNIHFYIKSGMIQCIDRGKSLNFTRDVQLDGSVQVLEKLAHISSQTLLLEKNSESCTFTGFGQTFQLARRVREPPGTQANVSPQGGNNETHLKASWVISAARCQILKSTTCYIVCAKWIRSHSEPRWEIMFLNTERFANIHIWSSKNFK